MTKEPFQKAIFTLLGWYLIPFNIAVEFNYFLIYKKFICLRKNYEKKTNNNKSKMVIS